MRTPLLILSLCFSLTLLIGCGAPEEKKIEVSPEVKAKNDQQHAAMPGASGPPAATPPAAP